MVYTLIVLLEQLSTNPNCLTRLLGTIVGARLLRSITHWSTVDSASIRECLVVLIRIKTTTGTIICLTPPPWQAYRWTLLRMGRKPLTPTVASCLVAPPLRRRWIHVISYPPTPGGRKSNARRLKTRKKRRSPSMSCRHSRYL